MPYRDVALADESPVPPRSAAPGPASSPVRSTS